MSLFVERHKLTDAREFCVGPGDEGYFHILCGGGWIDVEPIGRRRSVFAAPVDGLFVQGPKRVEIVPDRAIDVIMVSAPSLWPVPGCVERIGFDRHTIGGGTAEREVREILGSDGPATRLRIGETVNLPGGWSSWPPHHFDKENISDFQEVFYVFTDPKDGYGIMRINGELREVRSGDRVDVPLGEHPIVAGPGVRLMYFWAYVGADKIYPKWAEDVGQYK